MYLLSWPLYRHLHMGVSVSTINLLNVIHSPGWQHINATLASRCTLVQSDLTGAANNFSRIMLCPEQSTVRRFRHLFNNLWSTSYAHLTFSIRPSRSLVNERIINTKHDYKRSILHYTINPFSVTASSAYTSRHMTHLSIWGSTTA